MSGVEQADGRSRRWDDHKQERRDRILQAAVEVVHEAGDVAGVQDIADRAGVPRAVVYRLFKDRDDLDEQLRERIVADLMAALGPALTPRGTIADAIATAVDAYVDWIVENPNLHLFLGTGSATRRASASRVVTSTRTAIAVRVASLLEAVLDAEDADSRFAEPIAFAITGMVDSTVNRWLHRSMEPITPAELSDFLQVTAWQLLDIQLRRLGVILTPQVRVDELPGISAGSPVG